jgi:hypothetical protein
MADNDNQDHPPIDTQRESPARNRFGLQPVAFGPNAPLKLGSVLATGKLAPEAALAIQRLFLGVGGVFEKLQTSFVPLALTFAPLIEAVTRTSTGKWQTERWKELTTAAEQGWFVQPEMSVGALMKPPDAPEELNWDDIFTAEINSNIEDIRARLVASFPTREALIAEGFDLHRQNRFLASIPLLMNCAEGIVLTETKQSAFSTRGSGPEIAGWTRKLGLSGFDDLLAAPLSVRHPLSRHDGDSRHRINHGLAVDYGNERGSLQAISFLGFVGWLFCPSDGPLTISAEEAGWTRTSKGWKPPAQPE